MGLFEKIKKSMQEAMEEREMSKEPFFLMKDFPEVEEVHKNMCDEVEVLLAEITERKDRVEKIQKEAWAKIRELMKLFPCIHIAIDKQGGGIAVTESLHDPDKIHAGEQPLWEVIDEDKHKDTDDYSGLHIIEMCQFAKYDWLAAANHGVRKDFEDKVLLFPFFDPVSLDISQHQDETKNRMFDTLEECVLDIEELKDELSMIQMTQTASGRDRWDTPEVVVGTGKKSKMRKDRYSALLMANMAARILQRTPTQADYEFYGGFATGGHKPKEKDENMYTGPSWFADSMKDVY